MKTPTELSCQCVPFCKGKEKNDLEMSHLYFKFSRQYVAMQPKFLLSGKRQMSLLQSKCKA
jgi:hypothetical protein